MAFYINGRNDSHELFLFNLLYGKNVLARTFAWKLNCSEEKPEIQKNYWWLTCTFKWTRLTKTKENSIKYKFKI